MPFSLHPPHWTVSFRSPSTRTLRLPLQSLHMMNPTPAQPAAKPKRRSGRSAVPSWDEILFGD